MAELLGSAYVEVHADMGHMPSELGKVGEQVHSFFESLAEKAGELLPFASAAAGIAAAGMEFEKSKEAALEYTDQQRKLNAVLEATGHAAGLSIEQLNEHNEALKEATGQTSIADFQATLLTFRNVQGQVFKDATQAALGLSAVYGTDLRSAARLVGLALDQPAQGMERLRRVGIVLSEAQKNQIKNFVALGDAVGAQNVILDEMRAKFPTTIEQLEKVTNPLKRAEAALHTMREELGGKLMPIYAVMVNLQTEFVSALSLGADVVAGVVTWLQQLNEATGGYALVAAKAAIAAMLLARAIPFISTAASQAMKAIKLMLVSSGWGIAIIAIGAIAAGLAVVGSWLSTLKPVQEAWARGVEKMQMAWNHISTAVAKAANALMKAFGPVLKWLGITWNGTWKDIEQMVGDAVAYMIDVVSSFILDSVEWAIVLIENYDKVWLLIQQGAEWAFSRLGDIIWNYGQYVIDTWKTIGTVIWDILNDIVDGVSNMFNEGPGRMADNIAASIQRGINAQQKNIDNLFAPSDASNAAMGRMAQTAAELMAKKMEMEAQRMGFATGTKESEEFKAAGPHVDAKTKPKAAKAEREVEGFFGPQELAKKLQEAMIGDKNAKLLAAAEGAKKVQEDMLVVNREMRDILKKNPPLEVAEP